MKKLSEEIKSRFYQVIYGEIKVEEFETWLYANKELETYLDEVRYYELISFNYKRPDARYNLEKLLFKDYVVITSYSIHYTKLYEVARKAYLKTAQKKKKSSKEIRSANKKQLNYLKRDIKHINNLLDTYEIIPLNRKLYKYLLVIQEVYRQQRYMHKNRVHSVEHRIVSIHQPHVRPIVRGKANAHTEFGAKINVSSYNFV